MLFSLDAFSSRKNHQMCRGYGVQLHQVTANLDRVSLKEALAARAEFGLVISKYENTPFFPVKSKERLKNRNQMKIND